MTRTLKLAAGCFLVCAACLGALGMRDTDRRKLPLSAWGGILLFAAVRRGGAA